MSKNKKKRRRQLQYNQTQFKNVVCTSCGICEPETKPIFCFKENYLKDPHRFMSKCYPRLCGTNEYSQNALRSDHSPSVFQDIFCKSNLCGKNTGSNEACVEIFNCMFYFAEQLDGGHYTSVKKKKKKKKKKDKYICQPYPTFFSNNNEYWQEKIRSVLIHEDNNIESDKNKTDAGNTKTATNSAAKN